MAEKGSAPPMSEMPSPPQAPPSYEASVGGAVGYAPTYPQQQGVGGGFVQPGGTKAGFPPQQQGAPPPMQQQGQPQQTVIVQYMNPPNFGASPVNMTCPNCQCQIRTSTDSEPGPLAYILAGVLCVVGLWPCACIPCCIDSLNSVTHKCPNCKNFLGRYKGGM